VIETQRPAPGAARTGADAPAHADASSTTGGPHALTVHQSAPAREARLLLECRQRRFKEDEHLCGVVEGELLEARCERAQPRTVAVRPASVGSVSARQAAIAFG
jgi:hypothetical protein